MSEEEIGRRHVEDAAADLFDMDVQCEEPPVVALAAHIIVSMGRKPKRTQLRTTPWRRPPRSAERGGDPSEEPRTP